MKTPRHGHILAALLVVAAGLRLWNVAVGLPDFLEEAIPFRIALAMKDVATGRIDWNPHSFNYPSLAIYLHFAVQQLVFAVGRLTGATPSYADYVLSYDMNPTAMVIPARLVGIACELLAIAGVVRIGERLSRGAGLAAAGVLAFAPLLVTTSHSIFCDSLMAVLAVWSVERMIAYSLEERTRDIVVASVLVGLAAGAKYPAGALVLPMAWLVWRRPVPRAPLLAAALMALAFTVFLATTPFAVLDPKSFWRDFSFEGGHASGGHLGSVGHVSFLYHLGNLVENLGRAGAILLPVGVALSLADRRLRPTFATLGIAVLAFGLPISLARIEAERYLVPVLLLAAPIAAAGAMRVLERVSTPWLRRAWVAALVVGSLPLVVTGVRAAARGYDTTQLQARRWCEAHVGRDDLVVQEAYAARLVNALQKQQVTAEPAYARASARTRARLDSTRAFHVVTLPVFVAGRVTTTVRAEGRPPADLEVMPHASALNAAFYDLRLYGAADWFITSAGVRGRYQADHERYGAECEFYRALDRRARRVATFVPHGGVIGPEIRVYRIGDRFREGSTSIDPRWWAASVPDAYRARFRSWQGGADGLPAVSPPLDPPAWLRSLEPVYARYVQPFVSELTTDLAVLGRDEAARDLARATLEIDPVDVEATLLYGTCSGRLGRWEDARAATERTLAAGKEAEAEPALVVLSARALEHTGDARAARRRLTRLLDRHDLPKDAAFAAEQLLASLRPAPAPVDSLPIAADP